MADGSGDDDGYPLSPSSFAKKINDQIDGLTRLVVSGLPAERECDSARGQIMAYRKALEIFLNRKK